MTFLHKLARRLAGIPTGVLALFLLASCQDGLVQDYLGPDPHTSNLVSVSISPRDPQIAVGDSLRFEATGWLSTGKSAPVQVSWSASGGTITSNGWFRPAGVGEYRVRIVAVAKSSLTDSVRVASYNLVGGIQRLMVLPAVTAVPRGATQQFTAQALLNDGSTVSPTVAWSATGGSISSSGLFVASGTGGTAEVSASLGAGLATASSEIQIQPAYLSQLVLDPSLVTMETGETRQFTVAASWTDGSSTLPSLIWHVEGGTLSNQNVYTAGSTPGTYNIVVTSPTFAKSDTTVVWILPRLTGVRVTPEAAALAPGATQVLQALALRNDGSESPAGVQWTATGGTIGINGTYRAGSVAGQYRVVGTLQGLNGQSFADTASMVISAGTGTLTQISLTPNASSVVVGGSLQFAVSGTWSDGSSAVPAVNWSATGGTIDANGLYTAAQIPGNYRVIATQLGGTRADTAFLSVVAKVTGFRIAPKIDTMVEGQSRQFSATLNWSDGQTHPVTISWTTSGGAISSTGDYSPGSLVGSFLVVAACSCGAADTAAVTVLNPTPPASPTLMSLHLAPHAVVLALGGMQQFSPTGTWSDGTTSAVGVIYNAEGGNISTAGFYVAGDVAGTYRVIATQQGGTKADTAIVTVNAGVTLNQVVLNPAAVVVPLGGTQQFSVSGLWSDGSTTAPTVSYSATGGTVDSDGVFTAGSLPGSYLVIATQQGGALADTSQVTVGPTLSQLVMNPSSVSVFPGSAQQFAVSASWTDGSSQLPPLKFGATGGTVSAGGLYTAGSVPGSYQLIVRHDGGTKADTSNITIPTLTGLTLSPQPATVPASGSQLFSVSGTWSNGATTPPAVNYTATGGTISPAGLYVAGSNNGTFQVIAKHKFGTRADTSVVTISGLAPPPPSSGDLVVYPSPEVEFIIGPQLRSGSSANPWPWFDENELAKGLEHGANFPALPPDPSVSGALDVYLLQNYYDLALCLYTEYYRTGNPTFLQYARKVADSWWKQKPGIDEGRMTNFESYDIGPRVSSLGGLMLRALDGRPEMWPWILSFVNYDYDIWLGLRINNTQLHQGVRDGGYMLLYTAQLSKVHPDPAVRAQLRAKALTAARDYYARLQNADGGFYWEFEPAYVPQGGDLFGSQPFMVGLLLEGLIATHQLTSDPQVAQSITRAVDWLYEKSFERQLVTNLTGVRWRAMKYFTYRTNPTINDRTSGEHYGTPDGNVYDQRGLNQTTAHAFGYAFKLTGDPKYRDWGDDVFSATYGKGRGPGADAYWGLADFREKEYDQSYRASGRYLVWRLGH
jgi:hypothetical protein